MSKPHFRSSVKKSRLRRPQWVYAVFGSLTVLLTFGVFTEWKLRPTITAAAEAIARRAATDALNDAITEEIAQSTDFGQIVHLDKDGKGDLSAGNFDFPSVIRVQTHATERAETLLRQLGEETFRVPLLQTVGGSLASSYGPTIPVKTYLVGTAHGTVQAEQKTVGINQTVHMLYLDLTAQIHVVAPLVNQPIQVHSRVLLAYIILNGKVPNTYMAPGTAPPLVPFGNGLGSSITGAP